MRLVSVAKFPLMRASWSNSAFVLMEKRTYSQTILRKDRKTKSIKIKQDRETGETGRHNQFENQTQKLQHTYLVCH